MEKFDSINLIAVSYTHLSCTVTYWVVFPSVSITSNAASPAAKAVVGTSINTMHTISKIPQNFCFTFIVFPFLTIIFNCVVNFRNTKGILCLYKTGRTRLLKHLKISDILIDIYYHKKACFFKGFLVLSIVVSQAGRTYYFYLIQKRAST